MGSSKNNSTTNITAERDTGIDTGCPHHWKIESPSGPLCKGRCQVCGEERDFHSSMDYFDRDDLTLTTAA